MSEVVVVGYPYWGKGPDLKTAKAQYTRQGGRLREGYTVLEFEGTVSAVDEMGRYYYTGPEPTETKVASRRRSA